MESVTHIRGDHLQDETTMGLLRAGVGKVDITVGGNEDRIHDRLYAKALVLDDGATRIVIVTVDALAIGGIGDIKDDFLPRLRDRIEKEMHIPGSHVLVNASHTHPSGPLLCTDKELVERVLRAIRTGFERLTRVKLGVGRGFENRITINRNLKMKDGTHWTIRVAHPTPPNDAVVGMGPIDPEIGIIRIDHLDGQPFAVVYNFASHPLIGVPGRLITADFPGFASKVIEESLGNDSTAFFLQGAAGDLLDPLYKDVNRPRDAEPRGVMLGLSTLKAFRNVQTENASINAVCETIELPRRTDIPERINDLRQKQNTILQSLQPASLNFKTFLPLYMKYMIDPEYPSDEMYAYLHARDLGTDRLERLDTRNRQDIDRYMQNISAMEELTRIEADIATLKKHQVINDRAGTPTISAEIQGIKIGDCVLITAPFEALVEIGLNIKKASPYEFTFMAAFSNGYMHYGAPAADYDKGGYEVTECLLAPEWQQMYEEKALEIINSL